MNTNMPVINFDKLYENQEALKYARLISKSNGQILTGKPNINKDSTGKHQYIWRMVTFQLCSYHPYCCMPCTADWNLEGNFEERRVLCKQLDTIVDAIVNSFPKEQWGGIIRWGRALGAI